MIEIETMVDCVIARSVAQRFAASAGLDSRRSWEVGIVAGELASNIVKHSRSRGRLKLRNGCGGVHLIADDRGPGMPDPTLLLKDAAMRLDPTGTLVGLGCGGGTLVRLLDAVTVHNRSRGGLRVHGLKRPDGRVGL